MIRTLYLHIGAHKTGSTSIQQSLFKSTRALKERGIGYFQYSANHSAPIYWLFSERRHEYHLTLKQRLSDVELASKLTEVDHALKAFLSDSETKTKIISGEDISRLAGAEAQRMKSYLELAAKCETKVIIYIRNLYEFLDSTVQELVKNGVALSDLEMALKQGRQIALPQYRAKIETFVNVFGRDNVNVRVFDQNLFRDGDLLTDFCDAINVPDLVSSLVNTRANTSISDQAVRILSKYNELFPLKIGKNYNTARTERFQNYFNGSDGLRFRVTDSAMLDAYEKATADDGTFLQAYLGHDLAARVISRPARQQAAIDSADATLDVDTLFHVVGKILRDLESYEKSLEIALVGLSEDGPEEEASVWLRNTLKYVSTDAVCRRLSTAFLRRSRLQYAMAAMKKAVELSPNNAKNHSLLGDVYQRRGAWDKAEQAYRQAVALDETNAPAFRKLSGSLAKLDRSDEARRAAQRAVELSPDTEEYRRHLRSLRTLVTPQVGDDTTALFLNKDRR